MKLESISVVLQISKKQFNRQFIAPRTPVIIRNFLNDCPALHKWNYEYFKEKAGNKIVSVHGAEDAHPDKITSPPVTKLPFCEFLDRIKDAPTDLRLFLFNLLVDNPEMRKEISPRILAKNFLMGLPLMFFGGEGSSVRMHYDIDMSHVFLTQFEGRKRVLLFPNDQSELLYRFPYNFHCISDLRQPDYEKFPALRHVQGYECILEPGDTLFIPSGYWHYIQYLTQGYSVSYRAISISLLDKLTGFWNITIARKLDTLLRKTLGTRWFDYKIKIAYRRAEGAMAKKIFFENGDLSLVHNRFKHENEPID